MCIYIKLHSYIYAAITTINSIVINLINLEYLTQTLMLPQLHVMTFHCHVPHVASITVHPSNDIDDDDDTTNITIFIILLSLSLVLNILLAIVIIYLIVRLKKITTTANSSQM